MYVLCVCHIVSNNLIAGVQFKQARIDTMTDEGTSMLKENSVALPVLMRA